MSERDEPAVGAGGAVQRLLDREHVRVAGGLVDERLDRRRERVVGVVHEHVALLEDAEEVGRAVAAGQHRLRLRRPGLVLQLGPVEPVELPQPGEVERRVDDVDVGVGELELAAEELEDLVAHVGVDLEPDHHAELRPPRAAPARSPRAGRSASSSSSKSASRVTRNGMVGDDLHAREQRVEVGRDHLLERDEALAVGEPEEAGEQRRHLHPGEALVAGGGVAHAGRRGSATGSRCRGTGAPGRPRAA